MSLDPLLESKYFLELFSKICTDILKWQRKPTRVSVAFYLIVSCQKKKIDSVTTCWKYTKRITIWKNKMLKQNSKECSKVYNAGRRYQSHSFANISEKQP